jgi:Transcription factor WhiB.
MREAACGPDSGVDPEIFFDKTNQGYRKALEVCITCTVILQCRRYKNEIGATDGTWAGEMIE